MQRATKMLLSVCLIASLTTSCADDTKAPPPMAVSDTGGDVCLLPTFHGEALFETRITRAERETIGRWNLFIKQHCPGR